MSDLGESPTLRDAIEQGFRLAGRVRSDTDRSPDSPLLAAFIENEVRAFVERARELVVPSPQPAELELAPIEIALMQARTRKVPVSWSMYVNDVEDLIVEIERLRRARAVSPLTDAPKEQS